MNCFECRKSFTNKTRKEIKCLRCNISSCRSCLSKKIIKDVNDYSCSFCKGIFTDEILEENLSKTIYIKWKKEQDTIRKLEIIGSGGFGECSLIRRGKNVYVMKEPKRKGLEYSFQSEINVHKLLKHPNIVPFCESFTRKGIPHILLYPCINGSLSDLLHKMKFSKKNKKIIIQQVLNGLEYLQIMRVVHRDLKQHNLLFDEKMNLRIGDFGLAKVLKNGEYCYSNCGTPNFKAPEVIRNGRYSFECDIWSLGIIVYRLFLGTYPFHHKEVRVIEDRILNHRYKFPSYTTEEEKEFITWILNPLQEKRPTLHEIKSHKFLRE